MRTAAAALALCAGLFAAGPASAYSTVGNMGADGSTADNPATGGKAATDGPTPGSKASSGPAADHPLAANAAAPCPATAGPGNRRPRRPTTTALRSAP